MNSRVLAVTLIVLLPALAHGADPIAGRPAELALPDEGFVDATHEAHAGKVVFSHQPIPRKGARAAAFITSTTLLEPIYMRVYMPASAVNMIAATGKSCQGVEGEYITLVSIEGVTRNEVHGMDAYSPALLTDKLVTEERFTRDTTFTPGKVAEDAINDAKLEYPRDNDHDQGQNPNVVDYRFASGVVSKLSVGTNLLTFRVRAACEGGKGTSVATGQLEIVVGAGDLERFARAHGPRIKAHPLKGFAAMADDVKALCAQNLEGEIVRVFPLDDWELHQNSRGVVVSRTLTVGVIARTAGGGCTINRAGVMQRAAGKGRFDKGLDWDGDSMDARPIPCTASP
jgi:hypothetical protein